MDTSNFVNRILHSAPSTAGKLHMLQKLMGNCNLEDFSSSSFRDFLSLDDIPVPEKSSSRVPSSVSNTGANPPGREALRAIWDSPDGAATITERIYTFPMPERKFHELIVRALVVYGISDGLNAIYHLLRVLKILTAYGDPTNSVSEAESDLNYFLEYRGKIRSIRNREEFKRVLEIGDAELDEMTTNGAGEIKENFADYFHERNYWLPVYKALLLDILCARLHEMVPTKVLHDIRWQFVSGMLSSDPDSDQGGKEPDSETNMSADSYLLLRDSFLKILDRLEKSDDLTAEPAFSRTEQKQLERAAALLKNPRA